MGRAVSGGWVEVKEGISGQFIVLKDSEAGKMLKELIALLKKGAREDVAHVCILTTTVLTLKDNRP